jgi:hypothetical protein
MDQASTGNTATLGAGAGSVDLRGMRENDRWRWLIDHEARDDEEKRCFLYQRWFDNVVYVDNRERKDARWFLILRSFAIIGAAAISALAGIGAAGGGTAKTTIEWIVFGLGLAVAASATIEQLAHFGQHRLLGRQARELLKSEGSRFFFRTGEYSRNGEGAYARFRERVEAIVDKYNKDYERTITEAASSAETHSTPPPS